MEMLEIGKFANKQQMAVRELLAGILDGRYEPGRRLRQEEIAAPTGLSRTPIRDAFRQLEQMGMVSLDDLGRATVAPMLMAELHELYFIRLQIEPAAARLGAERMDDDTLVKMRAVLDEREALLLPDQLSEFLQLDESFHLLHYSATGYPRVCSLFTDLRRLSERYIRLYYLEKAKEGIDLHWLGREREVLGTCEQRDGPQAERLARAGLLKARDELSGFLGRTLGK